jgi:hypothetical protein
MENADIPANVGMGLCARNCDKTETLKAIGQSLNIADDNRLDSNAIGLFFQFFEARQNCSRSCAWDDD